MASAAASSLPAELIGAVGGWLRSREPVQVCGSLDAVPGTRPALCDGRGRRDRLARVIARAPAAATIKPNSCCRFAGYWVCSSYVPAIPGACAALTTLPPSRRARPSGPAGILDRSPECFDTEIFWQSSLELKLRQLHRVTELGRARGRLLETICATIGSPNEVMDDDQFGQTNSSGVNAG